MKVNFIILNFWVIVLIIVFEFKMFFIKKKKQTNIQNSSTHFFLSFVELLFLIFYVSFIDNIRMMIFTNNTKLSQLFIQNMI